MTTPVQNLRARRKLTRSQGLWLLAAVCLLAGGLGGAAWWALNPPDLNLPVYATPAPVSFPAPALVLSDLSGQPAQLTNLRGHVVLLNNWATWCPPCKQEMPDLQRYYTDHQAQGFVLVAVDQSEPLSDVQEFIAKYELTFPVWLDPQNRALAAFANQGLPNSYVIDRSGTVRFAWTGAVNRDILEKVVTPLFEEK